jgi:ATP-binding protein involved in chromosome partitioning
LATRIFCEARPEGALASAGAENGETAPLRLPEVRAVVAIASAKGGVGKTAICVNAAAALAIAGRKVAIVDADLNSPSVLAMLGMRPLRRFLPGEEIEPAAGPLGIRVVSSALLADGESATFSFLDTEEAPPGALSNGARPLELDHRAALRRLLTARFGPLDVILVDLASGLAQLHYLAGIVELAGVVIVTQPTEAAVRATRNALETLRHGGVPVLGLVENMLGFNCDSCHTVRPLFPQGDVAGLARAGDVSVLGRLPFDPRLADCCERGTAFVREHADTPLAKQFGAIAAALEREIARRAARPPAAAV